MLKLSQLKKHDRFYIFDKNYICYENTLIECEVIQKFAKSRVYVLVNLYDHVYPGKRQPVTYEGGFPFPAEIYAEAEEDIFAIDHFENACEHRDEWVRIYEIGMRACHYDTMENWYEIGKFIDEYGHLDYEERWLDFYKNQDEFNTHLKK